MLKLYFHSGFAYFMTLDQLEVLLAIVKTGSFHGAANELHKSRSAISITVKNLEEELGIQLFSRDSYRPHLTLEGKAYCEKARLVLRHAANLKVLGEQLSTGNEPEIRLVINALCPMVAIVGMLHMFRSEHPHTKLILSILNKEAPMEQLVQGKVDLALTTLEGEISSNIESSIWAKVELIPVAAPFFPLTNSQDPLNPEDMLEYVQVTLGGANPKDPFGTGESMLLGQEYWVVDNFYLKKELLLSGLGWGVVPIHLIEQELGHGSLVPLKIKNFENKKLDLYFFRKTDEATGPVAQSIWELINQKPAVLTTTPIQK